MKVSLDLYFNTAICYILHFMQLSCYIANLAFKNIKIRNSFILYRTKGILNIWDKFFFLFRNKLQCYGEILWWRDSSVRTVSSATFTKGRHGPWGYQTQLCLGEYTGVKLARGNVLQVLKVDAPYGILQHFLNNNKKQVK